VRPLDDETAKRIAKIREDLAERERELDRRQRRRQRAAAEREVRDRKTRAPQRARHTALWYVFLVGILALAFGLGGVAITLNRLAGEDMADARREGVAKVSSCSKRGPIDSKGFGYWESCEAEIVWDDGEVERWVFPVVFNSSDVGTAVRVGDLGRSRSGRELARADEDRRSWLAWISYGLGVIAVIPGLLAVIFLQESLRSRKKKQAGAVRGVARDKPDA
jgi:Family of unknown function (DUF6346)